LYKKVLLLQEVHCSWLLEKEQSRQPLMLQAWHWAFTNMKLWLAVFSDEHDWMQAPL